MNKRRNKMKIYYLDFNAHELYFKNVENAFKRLEEMVPKEQTVMSVYKQKSSYNNELRLYVTYKLKEFTRDMQKLFLLCKYDIIKTKFVEVEEHIQYEVKEKGKPYIPYEKTEIEKIIKEDFPIYVEINPFKEPDPIFGLITVDLTRVHLRPYPEIVIEKGQYGYYTEIKQPCFTFNIYTKDIEFEDEQEE